MSEHKLSDEPLLGFDDGIFGVRLGYEFVLFLYILPLILYFVVMAWFFIFPRKIDQVLGFVRKIRSFRLYSLRGAAIGMLSFVKAALIVEPLPGQQEAFRQIAQHIRDSQDEECEDDPELEWEGLGDREYLRDHWMEGDDWNK